MNTKTILTGIIILVIAIGGWFVFSQDTTPPLAELPLSEESSIKATATLTPEQPIAGEPTTIALSFTDGEGNPASDLMIHHARRVHAVFVSEDLNSIGHIHPQDFSDITEAVVQSGNYFVTYTFPVAGRYIVGVNVMGMDDVLEKQFIVNVKGTPKIDKVTENFNIEKCFAGYPEDGEDRYVQPVFAFASEISCAEGYKVTFSPSIDTITAGEEVRLNYHIERDGKPVMDLAPFLDAPIHFAIVPASLDTLLHRHGVVAQASDMMEMGEDEHMDDMNMDSSSMEGMAHHDPVPEFFGPNLQSESIVFPEAGVYQIFAQAKHGSKIIFSSFMVNVQEGFDEATAKAFDLTLSDRTLSEEIITVGEDDKIIVRVMSDEEGEFHIAGYEIEKKMSPGKVVELRFTANQAGRYSLEVHPEGSEEDIEIGALLVNPR